MGHLDLLCRSCGHEDFGVNSTKCVKCGSLFTHTTSDEVPARSEKEAWDDDIDADLESAAEDADREMGIERHWKDD